MEGNATVERYVHVKTKIPNQSPPTIYVTFSGFQLTTMGHKKLAEMSTMCYACLCTCYTNYKNISRMIPGPPLDFVFWGLCVIFRSMDNMHVCVCVWGRMCTCAGLLSLSPSARPLCRHTLQRAPSCHSWRHTAPENVSIRGRGETKREKNAQRKWQMVRVWSPTNHHASSVRFGYLLLYLVLPAAPHAYAVL